MIDIENKYLDLFLSPVSAHTIINSITVIDAIIILLSHIEKNINAAIGKRANPVSDIFNNAATTTAKNIINFSLILI